MFVVRTIVLSIIAIIYAVTIGLAFYFEIIEVLFYGTFPWSVGVVLIMAASVHASSPNPLVLFLLAGVLNLALFLWFCVLRPIIMKSIEVPD
jgi:hypothetical protein